MSNTADLEKALLAYLGGDSDASGIEPSSGASARLASQGLLPLVPACESVIDELMRDDQSWRQGTLELVGAAAAERMRRLHPELAEGVIQKLGNWYTQQWR